MDNETASNRRLVVLLVAAAACYAVGYPLALGAGSDIGWVFVTLGGPLLLGAGFLVLRRVYRSVEADERRADPPHER